MNLYSVLLAVSRALVTNQLISTEEIRRHLLAVAASLAPDLPAGQMVQSVMENTPVEVVYYGE
jgi:hypothetical protein